MKNLFKILILSLLLFTICFSKNDTSTNLQENYSIIGSWYRDINQIKSITSDDFVNENITFNQDNTGYVYREERMGCKIFTSKNNFTWNTNNNILTITFERDYFIGDLNWIEKEVSHDNMYKILSNPDSKKSYLTIIWDDPRGFVTIYQ